VRMYGECICGGPECAVLQCEPGLRGRQGMNNVGCVTIVSVVCACVFSCVCSCCDLQGHEEDSDRPRLITTSRLSGGTLKIKPRPPMCVR
jgi:hypothetical protein